MGESELKKFHIRFVKDKWCVFEVGKNTAIACYQTRDDAISWARSLPIDPSGTLIRRFDKNNEEEDPVLIGDPGGTHNLITKNDPRAKFAASEDFLNGGYH